MHCTHADNRRTLMMIRTSSTLICGQTSILKGPPLCFPLSSTCSPYSSSSCCRGGQSLGASCTRCQLRVVSDMPVGDIRRQQCTADLTNSLTTSMLMVGRSLYLFPGATKPAKHFAAVGKRKRKSRTASGANNTGQTSTVRDAALICSLSVDLCLLRGWVIHRHPLCRSRSWSVGATLMRTALTQMLAHSLARAHDT